MSKLLALDLATNVGHAVMVRGRPPLLGTLKLEQEGNDLARRLGRFTIWLDEMHAVHSFDAVAWERPIITPKDKVDKLEILYGLVGIAYGFAGMHGLPWREITIHEVKFALTGRSTGVEKVHMIAAAMKLGWKVATDHEADAGAVGLVAYERLWPKARVA
jgi:Holliday junction resolvasome RuvABC endonuclease subunit